MIKQSEIELDVHTHTIASGHAYSTLQEDIHILECTNFKA